MHLALTLTLTTYSFFYANLSKVKNISTTYAQLWLYLQRAVSPVKKVIPRNISTTFDIHLLYMYTVTISLT